MYNITNYQNVEELKEKIKLITKSRCSLTDEDVKTLNEVIIELDNLKRVKSRKRKTKIVLTIVSYLVRFFLFKGILPDDLEL